MIIVLRRYSWGLHFLTIALSSFLVAQTISTYISSRLESIPLTEAVTPPATEVGAGAPGVEEISEEEGFGVIVERNIFDSSATGAGGAEAMDPNQLMASGELGPAVKTALGIKLLGTLVIGDGTDRRSSATISGGKGQTTDVFFPGDEKSFAENVRLTKVMKDRIEFLNGSRLEYAELEDFAEKKSIFAKVEEVHGKGEKGALSAGTEAEPAAREGDKIVIDQGTLDEALTNLDRFYTEIRIVPHFQDGKVAGMKVLSVKPGSLVSKLGIKRGDILEKINGQELDVKRGMALFNELREQKNFSIDLVRGGKNQTLEYEIR